MVFGGAAAVVDVSAYFQDPDSNALTYTAVSSDTNIATVSVAQASIAITPVGAGNATITITASDGTLKATQTIAVSVTVPNRAPTAVGSISDQSLIVGGSGAVVDVSAYFQDPDSNALTYTAVSSDTNIATVSVAQASIAITPVGAGNATITITASDGTLKATQTIAVSVTVPNRAPTAVGSISDQSLIVGGSGAVVDVSAYFQDPDSNALTYTASSSDTNIATVRVSGVNVTITPVRAGSVSITITASDGTLKATQNIAVSIGGEATWMPDAALRAKVRAKLGLRTDAILTQQMMTRLGKLDRAHNSQISDLTGLEYATNLNALKMRDNQISDLTPLKNLTALYVLDMTNNQISDLTPLKNLTALNQLFLQNNQISDLTPLGNLTTLLMLDIRSNQVSNLTPLENLTALTRLNLASNPIIDFAPLRNLKAANPDVAIDIAIPDPNRAPTAVGSIPVQSLAVGGSGAIIDVSGYFQDADNDTLTYTASSSNTRIATVRVSGVNVTITPVAAGNTTLTITASDDDALTATQIIIVSVAVPNRAPTAVGSIPAQSLAVSDSGVTIDVSDYFQDADNDTLTYTARTSDKNVATVFVFQSQATLTPVGAGSATITITAMDGQLLTAKQTITVSVTGFIPVANRTPQVRDAIVAAVPGVNSAAEVTATHLAAITYLDLSSPEPEEDDWEDEEDEEDGWDLDGLDDRYLGDVEVDLDGLDDVAVDLGIGLIPDFGVDLGVKKRFTALKAGDFDGLTALTYLYLSGNDLVSLPAGIFDDLTALTTLDLTGNGLSPLPVGIFDNLTALRKLYLDQNGLVSLPVSIFDNLTALTELWLTHNDLVSLPAGIFDNLTALTQLWLSYNDLVSLPAGIFDNLTALTDLRLHSNEISDVSELEDLTSLTHLYLDGNPISDLGPLRRLKVKNPDIIIDIALFMSIANRTAQVTDAIIAAAGVSSADEVTETHLAAITELSIANKGITALKAGDFDGLTALTRLHLENNDLVSLPANIFDNNTALQWITLSRNALVSLPAGIFDNLTALERLYFYYNGLSSLPAGLFDNLTALTNLGLGENKLVSLPAGIFDNNTALTRLTLGYNDSVSLPAGIFDNLTALTYLSLSGNDLVSLPAGIFDNLTALTRLYLSGNELVSLPAGIFDNLTALRMLDLNANKIRDVSELEDLTSLADLHLVDNPISDYEPLRRLKTKNPSVSIFGINLDNNPPIFTEGTRTTRTVPENTAAGQNIGNALSATDPDGDALSYSLGGLYLSARYLVRHETDAVAFSIDTTTGQLQTRAALDYETKSSYTVEVWVSDNHSGAGMITVTINVTDVDETAGAPQTQTLPPQTALLANYPNPSNPETWIPYQLAKSADVSVRIYGADGKLVRNLVLGHQRAGLYQSRSRAAYWDGRNAVGEPVASGVYFYTLTAGDFSATRKMLIRK